jgi:hypothetical protein
VCWLFSVTLSIFFLAGLAGCGRFHEHAKPEYVYVFAEQTYLRDRVAAVSNRVALVTNGEPLEVVEQGRRFVKVKTSKGEVGWIEDHLVINQATYDQFVSLKQQHEHDPVVATGVLRDSFYLHLKPGRETDRFYLAPENDKLQLLMRASVPRTIPGAVPGQLLAMPPKPAATAPSGKAVPLAAKRAAGKAKGEPKSLAAIAPAIPMEDWWLVRDAQGQVGWLEARRFDVDVPDEIGGYSEGQRMVGAYVLTRINDPGSNYPDKQVPVYLAVLNSYKEGLPYDFDQIRVFTWNLKKHRYETGYRQRDLEGYLPVEITQEKVDGPSAVPVFAIRVAVGDAISTVDPLTGIAHPVQTEMLRFALEGQMVKKISPPGEAAAAPKPAHPRGAGRRAVQSRRRHHTAKGG